MKIKIIYPIHILLLGLVLFIAQNDIFSQGTSVSRSQNPGLFVGLNLMPAQSQILNEGLTSGSNMISSKRSSFSGSLEVGYYFSSYLGLSSGIGLSTFKSQLNLDSYQGSFATKDSENESYERRISGSDIEELQDISSLSIPVCINVRLPLNEKVGFFFQTGINVAFILGKNFESSGTFSYKGYYAVDNVLLENLPEFGFPSNVNSNSTGKLELSPLGLSHVASVGIDFYINETIQIALAGSYIKSLSSISKYTSPDNFLLSSDPDKINSFMGASTKATTQSLGLSISLRYFLR